MKIANVYRQQAVSCSPSDSLRDAARTMVDADTGLLLVLADGRLDGVISERDIVRALMDEADAGSRPVSAYATRDVLTTSPDEDHLDVARRMVSEGIRRMPVVGSNDELIGVVSMRDLFALEVLGTPEPPTEV